MEIGLSTDAALGFLGFFIDPGSGQSPGLILGVVIGERPGADESLQGTGT